MLKSQESIGGIDRKPGEALLEAHGWALLTFRAESG